MNTTDIGTQLRSSREALGLSVAAIAHRTRVQPRIISAIERNEIASIPPKPYGRGFVRAYAREVGLDPERTVRDYFAQFAPSAAAETTSHEPEPWPVRGSWLVPAAALMVLTLVGLAMFQGEDMDAMPTNVPSPVGTAGATGRSEAPVEAPAIGMAESANRERRRPVSEFAGNGAARADRAPAPAAGQPISIVLDVTRSCWIAARADGRRVLYQLMQPGTQHTIQASREVAIRAGDAGALHLTINGRDAGLFGRDGEVRDRRFTVETPQ